MNGDVLLYSRHRWMGFQTDGVVSLSELTGAGHEQ